MYICVILEDFIVWFELNKADNNICNDHEGLAECKYIKMLLQQNSGK